MYQLSRHLLSTLTYIAMTCFTRKGRHRFFTGASNMAQSTVPMGWECWWRKRYAVLLWHGVLPAIAPVIETLQQELNA